MTKFSTKFLQQNRLLGRFKEYVWTELINYNIADIVIAKYTISQ